MRVEKGWGRGWGERGIVKVGGKVLYQEEGKGVLSKVEGRQGTRSEIAKK